MFELAVRKMLSKYKALCFKHIVAYPSFFHMSKEEYEYATKSRCNQAMAQAIASHLDSTGEIRRIDLPEGVQYSLEGYFFTYGQLVDIAAEAYTKGITDAPRYSVSKG